MKRLLLILCISVIIAGVIALVFSALQGYGYYHLLDGDADMVSGLHRRMILYMLRDEALEGGHTEFYQLSDGLEIVYDRNTHSFSKFDFHQLPLEDDHMYSVGIQSYHFKNFEAMYSVPIEEIYQNGKPRMVATDSQEILEEYLSEHQNLDRTVSGRLIIH
ncbi:MAG: hypothetical protein IJ334_13670 [Clostridia bacterium]|nr:hypothetical protein [Clostridia bacterium]